MKTSAWYLYWMTNGSRNEEWKNIKLQLMYLEWLAVRLGVKSLDDWYNITKQQVLESPFGFRFLVANTGKSFHEILKNIWPHHNWLAWKHVSVPHEVWTLEAQRLYFLSKLKHDSLESLYELSRQEVDEEAGTTLLQLYSTGEQPLTAALRACFPEHSWLPWRFHPLPTGFWEDHNNQRQFLDHWRSENTEKGENADFSYWHSVSPTDLASDQAGASLLRHFGGSLIKALQSAYPEHEWRPWLFTTVPVGFWTSQPNRKSFLDWFAASALPLEQRFDATKRENLHQWYQIKVAALRNVGGRALLAQTGYSLYQALSDAYPHHTFDPTKFVHSMRRAGAKSAQEAAEKPLKLRDDSSERQILENVARTLKIEKLEDWYRISSKEAIKAGARFIEKKYGSSLCRALIEAFPEHDWQSWRFKKAPRGIFTLSGSKVDQ